ncbi:TetR/AcrR family transcriptional regulator [Micromonospora echinofusca]|uniref:TetR family transcriptional regulator n=1 Tax=Micromonospora echinofusca TaxID=47858 RepID=A0ABS3VJG5_MICEH|nr:TetR/AcrR family transcriptional regulator [Micromonospora echinofusca]MBO4204588.1 TetR family transcriptional regulator [Micromonospora echinofusca]
MARDTRERIVRVARDLVHGASMAQVSVEEICAAAGVHKGSLYHFFPSKDALGVAVLDANWALMRALLEEAFGDDVPPLVRIDRFVDGYAGMLALMRERMGATPGCPLGNLAAEVSSRDGEMRTRIVRIMDAWARYFVEAVREARGRGDVGPAVDADEVAVHILAHLQGMATMARAYDRPELAGRARGGVRMLLGLPA